MRLFLFIIFAILFFSCANKENNPPPQTIVDKFNPQVPKDSGAMYFPSDSLFFVLGCNQKKADSFVKELYSKTLFSFKEPILYNYSGEGQAVRLIWLRAFDNPVIVRVNKFNDTVYANIKELKNQSYNNAQQIIMDTNIMLNKAKWKEIIAGLQANSFWNTEVAGDSLEAKDGISWFLECRLPDKYHCINRWDDGDFSSVDLNLYARELINIGKSYVSMKSSK